MVMKDMRQVQPLKELLPKDTDNKANWDENQWYKHDE